MEKKRVNNISRLHNARNSRIFQLKNMIIRLIDKGRNLKLTKTDAVNQSNINAQKIGAFEIPLISIDEQKELVGKVAFLIDSEKMTRDSAEKTIKSIDEEIHPCQSLPGGTWNK